MGRFGLLVLVLGLVLTRPQLWSAENLTLNPGLNYKKNGWQGPLMTGDKLGDGLDGERPNYIIFYAGFCYNAKRQARRTVNLYGKYKNQIHFVTVDLSNRKKLNAEQQALTEKFFHGNIPQSVIIDRTGKVVFDYTGEAEEPTIAGWLDSTLR